MRHDDLRRETTAAAAAVIVRPASVLWRDTAVSYLVWVCVQGEPRMV